jgi:hypothetical protein
VTRFVSTAISIGCQQGGPEPCLIPSLKVGLYRLLAEHVTNTHCSEIDKYALVLRVDGSLDKFGVEGLARLRFAKSRRYITLDIQVPEEVWKPLDEFQTKSYLAKQVKAAIDACVGRLVKDGCHVNVDALQSEVDAALRKFVGVEE